MKKLKISQPNTFFFEDKPLFGLDIGHGTLRAMQFDMSSKTPRLRGYGSISFDPSAMVNGVIEKPEIVAKATAELFRKELIGDITTHRVAVSLPVSRAFTRAVRLPKMNNKDVAEAIRTEAEQYIPVHTEDLYLDYTKLREDDETIELFVVAMPKQIVDSYLVLTRMLGLEAVLFETSIGAGAQLFARDKQSDIPAVLVDFGSDSTDITVFNHGLVVTGTVTVGGDNITKLIEKALDVTNHEATIIKTKYGLGLSKKQKQIVAAMEPSLEQLMKEVRRTIRYYEERYSSELPIGQIVIMGGGANMPGLADYLTERLRLPVRAFDPTSHINFGHLQPFNEIDRMSYVTVAGLSLADPSEVFA
ncbi:MAG: type IV pilus assembly protein PilM [Candidatus Saccharimonadales bacterium]